MTGPRPVTRITRCANGHLLDEDPRIPVDEKMECPECGSKGRAFEVYASASVSATGRMMAHGRSGTKVGGRRRWEIWRGDDLHRDTGTWRRLFRLIDRRRRPHWYSEQIVSEAGDVVRDVEEPLEKHQGRGSARKRSD
jgi:hypothetical protein